MVQKVAIWLVPVCAVLAAATLAVFVYRPGSNAYVQFSSIYIHMSYQVLGSRIFVALTTVAGVSSWVSWKSATHRQRIMMASLVAPMLALSFVLAIGSAVMMYIGN